ncbi:hypothetical protein LBLM1_10850 (plasmid) [Limosilactobacillus mucosae LM1]|uniref:Uncharacterized protein n=1 Tax=Limosilactobacillus mucosae LM1 TaxID=1130798 RepID=A0A0D4CN71_LIMMU|nr:hypothetical protein [Limosilactobacillus mucosae]AJT51529.1 hypothetical protein LBLM1_10850 [Limosilactobacillus mucosae LM1]
MAIKTAQYEINKDVYHFVTDDNAVKVLDNNKNELGTLREFAFTGKVIDGGKFSDIKHSGIYRVKNMTGLPSNVPTNQESILSVLAVGDPKNPSVISYKVIAPNGVITENTVSGGSQSGWSAGGINLTNQLNGLSNNIGNITKLPNGASDVVTAINTINGNLNNVKKQSDDLKYNFEHFVGYDERYMKLAGGNFTGSPVVQNQVAYQAFTSKGARVNVAWVNANDHLFIGSPNAPTQIQGMGELLFNGHKVFTDANTGKGSNLDADKLDGIDSTGFVKTNGDDIKNGRLKINQNMVSIKVKEDNIYQSAFNFVNSSDQVLSEIVTNSTGDFALNTGLPAGRKNRTTLYIGRDGEIRHQGSRPQIFLEDAAMENEEQISFIHGDDPWRPYGQGMGFIRRAKENAVVFYNWRADTEVMYLGANNGEAVDIKHSPYIGEHHRRFFLQDEQPGGDVPYGSVWIGF